MIWAAVGASASAWLLGVLCVAALWPRPVRTDLGVVLSLGLGVGLGVTSALFFAASLLPVEPVLISAPVELLVAAGAGWWLWRQRRGGVAAAPRVAAADDFRLTAILGSVFAQACVVSLVVAARAYQAEPYSNSDGWTIWNLHARVLFRGGGDWTALLQRPQLAWTHPDYPLLVPASVARAWTYVGNDAAFVSGLISSLFGVATVGLLVSAVSRLRHPNVALTGGLVLLGTPFFVTFSSNQHADIPLGFYVLAALVLIAFGRREPAGHGLAALAGAAAGMAAWTKNEGILFLVVVGLAWCTHEWVRGSRRNVGAFLAGVAVALLPVIYFKAALAPANDIVASQPWARWPDLLDWTRHRVILASLWRDVWRFGEWSIVPFAAMVLPLLGSGWRRLSQREWIVGLVLGVMLAGFYIVYLLTQWDLASHIDSSLVRLLLQLWPAAVFFWCLAVTSDGRETAYAAGHPVLRMWPTLGTIVLANLAVAGGILFVLDRQLASNQLAAARIDDARVSVLLGDGWFARERHGRDTWAWSKGESTLLLRVSANDDRTVTLRFFIRSLGNRTVTAKIDDRVVWRARIGEGAERVEIAGLFLRPGTTAIGFQTDVPGVQESAAPGARALTYAIYNPEVGPSHHPRTTD